MQCCNEMWRNKWKRITKGVMWCNIWKRITKGVMWLTIWTNSRILADFNAHWNRRKFFAAGFFALCLFGDMNRGNSLDILVGIPHLWSASSGIIGECKYCRKLILSGGYSCEICSFPIHKQCMLKGDISSCGNVAPHQLEHRTRLANFLEKRPPKILSKARSAVSRTKWQRRWFVLTRDCNIFYFKDKTVCFSFVLFLAIHTVLECCSERRHFLN